MPAINVWDLDPTHVYVIEGDDTVRSLMKALRVPNLFSQLQEFDAAHAFVAFDNHPTHWIVLHLWKGAADYSPNHSVLRYVPDASPNGLLFEAQPKAATPRHVLEDKLTSEALRMGSLRPFAFSQLPFPV